MADQWLIRIDESDGPLYLYENEVMPVLVQHAGDAATFTNAAAKRELRKLGYSNARVVRRHEELRESAG
jgi:hypothetical protein